MAEVDRTTQCDKTWRCVPKPKLYRNSHKFAIFD
jgi:hypothetical protein